MSEDQYCEVCGCLMDGSEYYTDVCDKCAEVEEDDNE